VAPLLGELYLFHRSVFHEENEG